MPHVSSSDGAIWRNDTECQPFVPEPTFPPPVESLVRKHYSAASVVLEYGSGASTFLAAEFGVSRVFSVESDAKWAADMLSTAAAIGADRIITIHHSDIGPTRKWGKPRDECAWRKFHTYPLGIWDLPDFMAPDVVLIDGRFRVACLLAALFKVTRPTTVLFDDYTTRARYRDVEEFARPVECIDRMARFVISPTAFPADKLSRIIELFARMM